MANQEQVDLLKQGVEQWNRWRQQHDDIQPNLSGIQLPNANLGHTNLSFANLSYANLSHTDLRYADLRGTNLRYTHLDYANLQCAMLQGADLSSADLNGADLLGASLVLTKLDNTNLKGTRTGDNIFSQLDLRTARGVAEINHFGPSLVQLEGLQLPQDGSALHFLRGAGVSEEWINLWRSVMMHPIQYHSLFISYSSKDETLARRLHADLQASGVRCWFAPEDLKIGDKFRQHIDEAIYQQDKLLLLLSEHSIASTWVGNEVEAALEKEDRQQREVLFPVRLDDTVMQTSQAWAATLRRTRHIGDFSRWTDPQVYQAAFDRLLRDLKQN